jgi:NAD kinase
VKRLTDRKIVLVTRPTRLAELVHRFNTVSQARFYVQHQGFDFGDYEREDHTYHRALSETQSTLETIGKVQTVDRKFLTNFVFNPEDLVVTLGQDGLVANTLKYLQGQPVVGVNPDPERWDGKLLPFKVQDLAKLMPEVVTGRRPTLTVTMARASLNTGQHLDAVNDLFVGPRSHSSAHYIIRSGDQSELQSSSGVIISTGLGSSGWLKSLLTGAIAVSQAAKQLLSEAPESERPAKPRQGSPQRLSADLAWDADQLYFTVREPFQTRTTGSSLVFGNVTHKTPLILESRMAENGVIFSDGIESDFLEFNSGTQVIVGIADRKGVLIT